MRRALKNFGKWMASKINLPLPRKMNGVKFFIPMIGGLKVGTSAEPWMLDLLLLLLPRTTGLFLDVGANLGQTLIKVRVVEPDRNYVGFEPNPACVFYLHHLLDINAWNSRSTILPVGLSNMDGIGTLTTFGRNLADPTASLIDGMRADKPGGRKIPVPVTTYTSVKKHLPDGNTAIIKIDVEGGELEVLESLLDVLQRDQPVLLLELLPVPSPEYTLRWERQAKVIAMLRSIGYSLWRIKKSPADHFTGLESVQDLGVVSDPADQNYVARVNNKPWPEGMEST